MSARMIFAALTLATAVMARPGPVESATYWPWCAQYYNLGTTRSCAFVSWDQCMESVRGIGGYCYTNPYGPPPPAARALKSSRHATRQ